MQPMQPALQTFITTPPLSWLEQPGWMRRLSGMSLTMLLGQMSTHAPQPTQFARLTWAMPLTMCMASNWQARTQLPRPMQAKVQSLLLFPPKSMAAWQSSGPV